MLEIDSRSQGATVIGGEGRDVITNTADASDLYSQTILGNGGDDRLVSYNSNSTFGAGTFLRGGTGNDELVGYGRNTKYFGDEGDDKFYVRFDEGTEIDGGAGIDEIYFSSGYYGEIPITNVEIGTFGNSLSISGANLNQIGSFKMRDDVSEADMFLHNIEDLHTAPELILGEGQALRIDTANSPAYSTGLHMDLSNVSLAADASIWFSGFIEDGEVRGGSNSERISGGGKNGVMYGNGGDDTITIWGENAKAYGGDGDDNLSLSARDRLHHKGAALFGGTGDDTLAVYSHVRDVNHTARLYGQAGDDAFVISGDVIKVQMDGGVGVDTIQVHGGTLKGGSLKNIEQTVFLDPTELLTVDTNHTKDMGVMRLGGEAAFVGRAHLELMAVGTGEAEIVVDLKAGERLVVTKYNDYFQTPLFVDFSKSSFEAGSSVVFKGAGNGLYNHSASTVIGGSGDDVLYGGYAFNKLVGGRGDDYVRGRIANDVLSGNKGSDRLEGERGNDLIMGGAGDDLLDGGAGDDFLIGGSGRDTFLFLPDASQVDKIKDWTDGEDVLRIGGGVGFDDLAITQVGSKVHIQIVETKIILFDALTTDLDQADFDFF